MLSIDRETWQNIRNKKNQTKFLKIVFKNRNIKKKKKRKNFISINPPSFFSTSLFSFHIEPITSCQRLIDTTTPSREQESALLPFFFTISIQRNLFEIYRELSSTRITRVSILGGNWETVYYLYYRLLFREILEEERNLGGGQSRRNFIRDYSGKGTAFLSPGTGSRRRDNGKKNGSSFIRHSDEQREKSFGWFILE